MHFIISKNIYHKCRPFSIKRYMCNSLRNTYDIIILGSGIVGSTLASILANDKICSKNKILIINDTVPISINSAMESSIPSLRVSAINHHTVNILKKINVWNTLKNSRCTPYLKMEVWDYFSRGRITFEPSDIKDIKLDNLGYIVENNILNSILIDKLKEISKNPSCNVNFIAPVSVKKLEYEKFDENSQGLIFLSTEDKRTFRTKLLIGADGNQSLVKREFAFSSFGFSYNQKAIVTVVQHEKDNNIAYQRFVPNGPIGILPLNNRYSNIIWSTNYEEANYLLSLSDKEFVKCLNQRLLATPNEFYMNKMTPKLSNVLPNSLSSLLPILFPTKNSIYPPKIVKTVRDRKSFPLMFRQNCEYVKPRIALIGDSAHVVHPLAGQGVNMGINDAARLAEVIKEGYECGLDIGSLSILNKYETKCKYHNMFKLFGIDAIEKIFGVKFSPISLMRNIGLDLLNNEMFLKDKLMKEAMGLNLDMGERI